MTKPKAPKESVVVQRIVEPFRDRTVAVRVVWNDRVDVIGKIVAAAPVGNDYFITIKSGHETRVINTKAILEISEVVA